MKFIIRGRDLWGKACAFFANGWVCVSMDIVALAVYVSLECEIIQVPCCGAFAKDVSLSFVSASFFYFIVNYCPFKKRQRAQQFYIRYRLGRIVELLRQCKKSVCNPFCVSTDMLAEPSRDVYIDLFKRANLHDKYWFSEKETFLQYLDKRREELDRTISDLNSCREYLTDEEFGYMMDVANSTFLFTGVIPNDEDRAYYQNQDCIGRELYDLYERGRLLMAGGKKKRVRKRSRASFHCGSISVTCIIKIKRDRQ